MGHQLNSHPWDVSGATLCVPRVAPHVGWVLVNAELESLGSVEIVKSQLSPSNFGFDASPPSTNFIDDLFYSKSSVNHDFAFPLKTLIDDTFEFGDEFNFLPSSPESINFSDMAEMDADLINFDLEDIPNIGMDKPHEIFSKPLTRENAQVELAVQDPEVALTLLQQLTAEELAPASHVCFQTTLDSHIMPVLTTTGTLVSNQTRVSPPAFELVSIFSTDVSAFQVDSFFAMSPNSQMVPDDSNRSDNKFIEIRRNYSYNDALAPGHVTTALSEFSSISDEPQEPPVSPLHRGGLNSFDFAPYPDTLSPGCKKSGKIKPERKEKKKEQNKSAALKYRQKKRTEFGNFLDECQDTEKKNAELKLRVNEMVREINYLKGLLLEISVA